MNGVIYKGIGGFYYVKTDAGNLVECKPRGIFRKRGQKPLAGDKVRLAEEDGSVVIDEIAPRRNALARPPVANVDQLFIVASTTQPVPSLLVIDTLAAYAIDREAAPVLVVTKTDLADPGLLAEAYRTSGIPVLVVDAVGTGEGLDDLRAMLPGKLSVFCGNTGVGKSTIFNAIMPEVDREVGEISKKLGRGRHTTREVEIFEVDTPGGTGLLADTPGFASFDLQQAAGLDGHDGPILADNLQLCFPEIKSRIGQCKFSSCVHVSEAGCAVRAAVEQGDIAPGRYQSYVTLYEEAKLSESTY